MVQACQNHLTVTIPEITAMPEISIFEVVFSHTLHGTTLEVWFREPDGTT